MTYPIRQPPDGDTAWGSDVRATVAAANDHQTRLTTVEGLVSASRYTTVQDEGSALTQRGTLNFVGAGVAATDDAANGRTLVTIGGGSGGGYATIAEEGSNLTARTTMNFIGRPVTAVDNAGSTRTDVTVLDTVPVHTISGGGTSQALDAAATAGPVKLITLNSAACTFTFTTVTSGREIWMLLVLIQDATGGRLVTWPTIKWAGGVGAPTLSTPANAVDRVLVTTYNGGTTWYGDVVGKNYA